LTHFERLKKLANKSGHYYWKCTDSEGNGLHLEGHDNVLLRHLSNPWSCPNASPDDSLEGPKSIMPKDFDAAFDELDQRLNEASRNLETVSEDGQEVLEGQVYDFVEPERIDNGLAPVTFQEDVQLVGSNSSSSLWDVEALLMCR